MIEEDHDGDITDDFADASRAMASQQPVNAISFTRVPNLGKYAVSLSATHADGRDVPGRPAVPITDVTDGSGASVFSPAGTLHPSAGVVDIKGATKADGAAMLTVHVPYWPSYWGKAFTYSDEHCIEDGMPGVSPLFHTSVRVDNVSLGEGWDSLSSNMTRPYEHGYDEYYSGNYIDRVNEWTDLTSLTKTGDHRVTLRRADGGQTLFEETYPVTGGLYSEEKGNPRNIVSGSMGMGTLNVSFLYKRRDIQKYQVLTGELFDFTVRPHRGGRSRKAMVRQEAQQRGGVRQPASSPTG